MLDAIRAVEAVGFTDKRDFYHTLQACFVSRPEHRAVFAQVFRLFWRDPQFMEHMMSLLDAAGARRERRRRADAGRAPRRRGAARRRRGARRRRARREGEEVEIDATLTFSADEKLKRIDFEQMSAAELAAARARHRPARPAGAAARQPPHPRRPARPRRRLARHHARRAALGRRRPRARAARARRTRWPNLVALCDISGSMSSYSRMLLHFLHAAANAKGAGWAQVHAFTFGTRLTNITRHLRHRDVDAALAAAGQEARDWEGGTRIGACLHAFNRDWSRRVLAQGAVVLLITDGLDRDDPDRLARRDGAAAPLRPPADLAEPAAALGRLRAARPRRPRDPAARRQLPRLPQPRLARGARRRPVPPRRPGREGAAARPPRRLTPVCAPSECGCIIMRAGSGIEERGAWPTKGR